MGHVVLQDDEKQSDVFIYYCRVCHVGQYVAVLDITLFFFFLADTVPSASRYLVPVQYTALAACTDHVVYLSLWSISIPAFPGTLRTYQVYDYNPYSSNEITCQV